MQDTAGGVKTNSEVTFSYGPLYIDEQMYDDQLERIYNNTILMKENLSEAKNGEWELGKSALAEWYIYIYMCTRIIE